MPLAAMGYGETNTIKQVIGNDDVRRRLADMGFITGEQVTVAGKFAGNMILSIKGTRIALDHGLANRILV